MKTGCRDIEKIIKKNISDNDRADDLSCRLGRSPEETIEALGEIP